MKSKILYLGEKIIQPKSGADQVNKRNQTLLENNFEVMYLPTIPGSFFKFFLKITGNYLKLINKTINNNIFEYIFIEQSLYGRACRYIKKKYPKLKIIIFFHNIEVQYAHEYLKTSGLKAIPFFLLVKYWEKKSCKYADYCITLNKRDSQLLHKIYNRKSDLELPTSFPDLYDQQKAALSAKSKGLYPIDYLFVGVSFFANIEAVQWFINNVMPKVDGHLHVVGKGMDNIKFNNLTDRIHIHGFVDDLSEYYYRAKLVISPIHVGGGMKTKTAEALMYGKTILGSKEAFEGYEIDERCMILCNNVEDYLTHISLIDKPYDKINSVSRQIFKKLYSNHSQQERLNLFIQNIQTANLNKNPLTSIPK